MIDFKREGTLEIGILIILLFCIVLAIIKSESWRTNDEAVVRASEQSVQVKEEIRLKMLKEGVAFLDTLSDEERRTLLITSAQGAVNKRFEVFANAYSLSNTNEENELAFSRLARGVLITLAAAQRMASKTYFNDLLSEALEQVEEKE